MRPPRIHDTPASRWAFFLDFDGTLVRIAHRPDAVRADPALRRFLRALVEQAGGAVALISGRPIADIDRMMDGLHLPIAGQHGLERRSARGRLETRVARTPGLRAAAERLRLAAHRHRGLLLEDKGQSLALHYRAAPRLAGYAHRLVRAEAAMLPAFSVRKGKRVAELRPSGHDKGRAVRAFMREAPFRGRMPVFIGDDATDEDAFAIVNGMRGISVKVGAGPTAARWRLRDVTAVRRWLEAGRPEPRPA